MRGLVITIACAASIGCSERGILIDVDIGATGADHVELFVAKKPCDGCEVLGPQLRGKHVRFREDLQLESATGTDGHALFKFDANADLRYPMIVAVGLVGGTPVGFAKVRALDLANDPAIYQVTLEADGGARVLEVWRAGASACVMANDKDDETTIVPEGDPDCDGYVDPLECDPFVFESESGAVGETVTTDPDGTIRSTITDAACAAQFPLTNGDAVCRLAGGCRDGSEATCSVESRFCVPKTLCDDDASCDLACRTERLLAASAVTCTMELSVDTNTPCPNGTRAILDIPVLSTVSCTRFGFTSFNLQPLAAEFSSRVLDFGADGSLIKIVPGENACQQILEVVRPAAATMGPVQAEGALVEVTLDNDFTLIVPFKITYAPGACTNSPRCVVTTNDSLWSCAK